MGNNINNNNKNNNNINYNNNNISSQIKKNISNTNKENTIKIVCISDTHTQHAKIKDLPQADILIHAGDFTLSGLGEEIYDFANWLDSLTQFKQKIVIAGNHDITLDIKNYQNRLRDIRHRHLKVPENPVQIKERLQKSCIYLENDWIEVFGIKIYGSPYTPEYYQWGFQYKNQDEGSKYKNQDEGSKIWEKIPEDIDILITHGPPNLILDKTKKSIHAGCKELQKRLTKLKPQYHIFGHIHEGYGIQKVNNTTFVNCAICDIDYLPRNKPVSIEILKNSSNFNLQQDNYGQNQKLK